MPRSDPDVHRQPEGLGKPDTPSGQQIQDSVDKLTTTVDDESKTIQDTASSVERDHRGRERDHHDLDIAVGNGDALSQTVQTIRTPTRAAS